MAQGDFVVLGTFTLPKSGPGAISTVDVTATGTAADDTVLITPTSTVRDGEGNFGVKVTDITTNSFTVTADRPQLSEAQTFQFIVFDNA